MLKAIRDWIFAKTDIEINYKEMKDSDQLSHALCLLIKLAEIDGDFSPDESAKIVSFATFENKVAVSDAIQSFSKAEKASKDISSEKLLEILDRELSMPQKRDLLEMMYGLMKVDGNKDGAEKKFISKVISALKVPEDVHLIAYENVLKKGKAS